MRKVDLVIILLKRKRNVSNKPTKILFWKRKQHQLSGIATTEAQKDGARDQFKTNQNGHNVIPER